MSFAITGLENANEFYSQHYLDEILERDLKPLFERWKEQGAASPAARLRSAGGASYFRIRERFLAERKADERQALFVDLVQPLLQALGYDMAPQDLALAGSALPVLAVYRDAKQHPLLVIAAAVAQPGQDEMSPLQLTPPPVLDADGKPAKAGETDWEEALGKQLFSDDAPPRWVLLVHHEEWLLIERSKWGRKALLRFKLPELFGPRDERQFRAFAALAGAESVLPAAGGTALLDSLDDSSHKHAFEVSTDLKYALRECIELIGNEAIRYKREVAKEKVFERNDIDLAEQLSRECLRYMYRLLFLFYIEARPDLGYAPIAAESYLKGYSVEHLRELETTPLTTPEALDGFYFHDSLKQLFGLIWQGFPRRDAQGGQLDLGGSLDRQLDYGFTIAPLQGHLFDPARTPLLGSVRLRNRVLQRVIELMSLSRGGGKSGRRGRISYGTLGINQLGAVYESLLSFRGFFAEEDLYEVRPDPKKKKAVPPNPYGDESGESGESGDGSGGGDGDLISSDEDEADAAPSAAEKKKDAELDPLEAAYFVPSSRINQYTDAERLFGGQPRLYKKGTYIYRLAGRAREKSASYYTPEVLTKCLVEHALKELLPGKSADEILKLTVCEPAMGSAAFLNEAVSQLAEAYLQAKQKELGQTIPHDSYTEEKQRVKMFIADNNVFGVDLNPVAVELAEVSLWLNAIFKGSHVPWFGMQLCNGNSLVGARREVYSTGQLNPGKGEKDIPERDWRAAAPTQLKLTESPDETAAYHFLLPAEGMGLVTDKVIKSLEPIAFEKLKQWRKSFTAPLNQDEVRRVKALTRAAEELWQQHSLELARVRKATSDELHVWPDPAPNRAPTSTSQKDAIFQREMLSEKVKNASPYRRLKLAMDFWCALWFWPLNEADELPSREHWWFVLETVLLGSASLGGSQSDDLFPETQLQPGLDFSPERDRYGYVDIGALISALPQLQVTERVAVQQSFMHWELEFADVFKSKGGFDVVLGNPPWIKVEWNEKNLLSDFDARFAIRRLDAKEAADRRMAVFEENRNSREEYINECVTTEGMSIFLGSCQNYKILNGVQSNLYKCFLPIAWRIGSGVQGLVHPEGLYDDPAGGVLRAAAYRRLRAHYQFVNVEKLFNEVMHWRRYSVNVYAEEQRAPSFFSIANVFQPATIGACLGHAGGGETPGIKTNDGEWNYTGHANRVVSIDMAKLEIFSKIFDEPGSSPEEAKLLALHSKELVAIVEKIASQKVRVGSLGASLFSTQHWDEAAAKKTGLIVAETGFVESPSDFIISGPHFYVANPLYKTPRRVCLNPLAYDSLNLDLVQENYLQRCNFRPGLLHDSFVAKTPKVGWLCEGWEDNPAVTKFYRLVFRRKLGQSGERTLISAIFPPEVSHIDSCLSVVFEDLRYLMVFSALSMSIVFDFLVKITGKADFRPELLNNMPLPQEIDCVAIYSRVLALNCLTRSYSDLWCKCWDEDFRNEVWSSSDSRLDAKFFKGLTGTWSVLSSIRTEYSRRQALLEIDVLASLALGLTIDELIMLYRVQFPVLQQNDRDTWFDCNGRIIYTCNVGVSGSALPRKAKRSEFPCVIRFPDGRQETRRLGWEDLEPKNGKQQVPDGTEIERSVMDDTQPHGPVQRVIRYMAPFGLADREADYRVAWAHFAERAKQKSGGGGAAKSNTSTGLLSR